MADPDPSTTLFLSTPRAHPIALRSALAPARILASYRLIHEPTETYITPHSLHWMRDGSHFLTGSDSLIALFDVSRDGQGPVSRFPTIPSKRKKIVGGGVGVKGIVSALAVSGEGLLAAGTFTRQVGLYDAEGRGDCVAVFSLASPDDDHHTVVEDVDLGKGAEGGGVTQLLWSSCARYLYVVERKSDRILCYDVRVTGRRLASFVGRKARTNQRLGVDVISIPSSTSTSFATPAAAATVVEGNGTGQDDVYYDHLIWAGGTDGVVRIWKGPPTGSSEEIRPTWEWKVHDGNFLSSPIPYSAKSRHRGLLRPHLLFED